VQPATEGLEDLVAVVGLGSLLRRLTNLACCGDEIAKVRRQLIVHHTTTRQQLEAHQPHGPGSTRDASLLSMSTAAKQPPYPHVEHDAAGVPIIAGTTMKVVELVMAQHAHGWSPE
jgi:hypothetical protein